MFNKKLDCFKTQMLWDNIKAPPNCHVKGTYESSYIQIEEVVIFDKNNIDS